MGADTQICTYVQAPGTAQVCRGLSKRLYVMFPEESLYEGCGLITSCLISPIAPEAAELATYSGGPAVLSRDPDIYI